MPIDCQWTVFRLSIRPENTNIVIVTRIFIQTKKCLILTTIFIKYKKYNSTNITTLQSLFVTHTITPVAGGVLPSKRLLGMCRWMGSHFHNWTDYSGAGLHF